MPSASPDIQVYNESSSDILVDLETVKKAVSSVCNQESCFFNLLEVVYVDVPQILRINLEHLDRNYVTDIISFRYDEDLTNEHIEGTLFCCAPRIHEQASELDQDPETEFKRVLIHGLLHLTGYEDESEDEKEKMTERENFYLELLSEN